jgi:hypothetical protein
MYEIVSMLYLIVDSVLNNERLNSEHTRLELVQCEQLLIAAQIHSNNMSAWRNTIIVAFWSEQSFNLLECKDFLW